MGFDVNSPLIFIVKLITITESLLRGSRSYREALEEQDKLRGGISCDINLYLRS